MTRRTPLIIPSEVQTREFDAKLLLACMAAERGFASVVGCRTDIHLAIAALPRSIYVAKDVRFSSRRMFGILDRLGHTIIALDEEAPFHYSREAYLAARVSAPALRRTRALFAWGSENAEAWQGCPDYHGAPIHITGNPRVDMMREELRAFYAAEVEDIRRRFGSFILINSNFGGINHFFSNLRSPLLTQVTNGAPADPDEPFAVGLVRHKYALFQAMIAMVREVAKAYPDRKVIIRPHAAESHATWLEAGEGLDNLQVVHEGNVIPWLLAAEVMIHNGCTTGIEGYLLGTPVVAYQPVVSRRFDFELPNNLSHRVFNLDELIGVVGTALAGPLPCDDKTATEKRRLAEWHVASLTGPFAAQRMVDLIDSFEASGETAPLPSLPSRLIGRVGAEVRRQGKRRNARIPGHKNHPAYTRARFPGIELPEVAEHLTRLQTILGRFSGVKARQIGHNMFQILPP
jgi:surface carbohydrate biosynthesis protein